MNLLVSQSVGWSVDQLVLVVCFKIEASELVSQAVLPSLFQLREPPVERTRKQVTWGQNNIAAGVYTCAYSHIPTDGRGTDGCTKPLIETLVRD